MRTVSLWGKLRNDRGKAVLYIGIMAGIVQRVELTATSVSEYLSPFHIIIITGHCIKCQCLVFFSTATVALNSTYTREKQRPHNQPWFKQRALWLAEKSPEKDGALWLVYLFSWITPLCWQLGCRTAGISCFYNNNNNRQIIWLL